MANMQIEAMRLVLEALEWGQPIIEDYGSKEQLQAHLSAKDALYKAIEEAEQWNTSDMAHRSGGLSVEQAQKQEPVAWVDKVWVERLDISKQLRMELLFSRCQLNNNQIPLYTAPPASDYHEGWEEGYKAATAKLKERNNG